MSTECKGQDPGWRRTGIIIAVMVVVWAGVVANRGRIQGHYFAHRLLAAETAEENAYYFSRLAGLGTKASGAIAKLTRHKSADVRSLGVTLAQHLESQFGRELLLERLADEDREVRQMAALGLAFHHKAEALEIVAAMVNEPAEPPALAAALALERIGGPAAIDALQTAAKDHPSTAVRAQAIDSLGRLGAKAAMAMLIELLADETTIDFTPATDLAALRAIERTEHAMIQQGINPDDVEVDRRGPGTIGAMAARSLRRMTEQTFGYDDAQNAGDRKAAIEAWRAWHRAHQPS